MTKVWLTRVLPFSHYVLLALLFFTGLEVISVWRSLIIPLSIVLIILLLIGIILIRVEERGTFKFVQTILPTLTVVGLLGFTLFLPLTPVLHLYFALASIIFFLLLKHGARQAYPTWNWTLSVLILFLNMAVILGMRFHLYAPIFLILIAVFAVTLLVAYQALHRLTQGSQKTILLASASGLVLSQLAWVLLFLPLHYSIQAGILAIVYYVLFHMLSISFSRRVQRQDIIEYVGIGGVALLLLLITARWQ